MEQLTVKTADMDLTLDLAECEGALKGSIEYSLDLFNCDTVERMAGHLQAG